MLIQVARNFLLVQVDVRVVKALQVVMGAKVVRAAKVVRVAKDVKVAKAHVLVALVAAACVLVANPFSPQKLHTLSVH